MLEKVVSLLPHGADFLRGGQLATRNLGFGLGEIGIFLRRQLDWRLIHAGELEQNARKLVLRYNKLVNPSAESLWLALRIERKLGERNAESSYASQLRRSFPGSPEYQALQRGDFD